MTSLPFSNQQELGMLEEVVLATMCFQIYINDLPQGLGLNSLLMILPYLALQTV